MESFVSPKLIDFVTQKITSARCWGHRDPLDAKAEDAGGRGSEVVKPPEDPTAEPASV